LHGGRTSIAEKEIKEEFGAPLTQSLLTGWQAQFDAIVKSYRRFSL
jgi:hypothetical protein